MYPVEHIRVQANSVELNQQTRAFLESHGVSPKGIESNMAFGTRLQNMWFKAAQEEKPALTPEELEISQTEARIATATYFFYQLKESLFDYDLLQTEYKRLILANDIEGRQELSTQLKEAQSTLQETAVKLRIIPAKIDQEDEESEDFALAGKFELGFPNVWTGEAVTCRLNLDGTIDVDPAELLEGTELVKNMIGIYANYSLESRHPQETLDAISTEQVQDLVDKLILRLPIDLENENNAVALDVLATINEMWRNLRMARDGYTRPVDDIQTVDTIIYKFAEDEDLTMNDSEKVYTQKYNELMKDWYQFVQIRAQLKRIRAAV